MSLISDPSIIARVHRFNTIAQTVPPGRFNADRVGFYTGMQLEELAEKIRCIAMGHVVESDRVALEAVALSIDELGRDFKQGRHYGAVLRADREELLDADIDQLVVSIGSLIYSTPKFAGAVEAVLDANDAKFPDGVATRDANGKIQKPPGWKAPDLSPYVDHAGQE